MYRSRTVISIVVTIFLFVSFVVLAWGIAHPEISFHQSITSLDSSVQTFANENTSLPLAKFMLFITYFANTEIIIAVQAVLLLILVLVNEELLAGFFLGSLASGAGLSIYFKNALQRARPDVALYEMTSLGYAFPSGHALISTVFYGFLGYCLMYAARRRWQKVIIACLTTALIVLIGYSRLALGVHWFSDVLGGWLLGGALLSGLIFLFHLVERKLAFSVRYPKGVTLLVMFMVLIALGFLIGYFYVTHAAELRSIINGS
ncbi:phosphatase PAP2 family protein [Patescibacteria group bacterium]|nr:phosphatase PAP2 family protein [Patescibacteria group bacterium]